MKVPEMMPEQTGVVAQKSSFEELYEKSFPRVAGFVSKMNGTFEEAKDIFQDALVIYYEKTVREKFTPASAEGYLLGIAKHLWLTKMRKNHGIVSLDDTELSISLPDDWGKNPDAKKLLSFLEKTGKKCLELLRACYYQKLPAKDITKSLGYRNDHSTSVQKYKCLEKIRDTIKEKAMNYEDFLE